jgi:hypothetical protein
MTSPANQQNASSASLGNVELDRALARRMPTASDFLVTV